MSNVTQEKITFQVETSRVLEILSREIYDSPLALLRENLQNAYDAVLMRCTQENLPLDQGLIEVQVEALLLTIADNGIGMTEDVLRNNFWKAGSSGKKTDLARKSGVIGTFGIGAMANFGVCTRLRVETRAVGSDTTLVSTAERAKLSISQECVDLERLRDQRPPGTKLIVELDSSSPMVLTKARDYLRQYVSFLPVKVLLNGELISQCSYADIAASGSAPKKSSQGITEGPYAATVDVHLDGDGRAFVNMRDISLAGTSAVGELVLVQNGGQLMGLRSSFGLAPVPVGGNYQLGGYADLSILEPTAGREALSRESIEHVNRLVRMAETSISDALADDDVADRNVAFMQHIMAQGKIGLAGRVTIQVLPDDQPVPMGRVKDRYGDKKLYSYAGRDQSILQTFASDQACVLHVSRENPRRQLQLRYLREILHIEEVPDRPMITREYSSAELTLPEASFLARLLSVLTEFYLLPDADLAFADISHGVAAVVSEEGSLLRIRVARTSPDMRAVLGTYTSAREVFDGFVKDFARNHLYQRIAPYMPSSTRQGVDALVKLLQRNRELYRYDDSELGDLEPLLGDFLGGEKSLGEVIATARSTSRPHTQRVSREQVGSLEEAMPDVVESPVTPEKQGGDEYEARPSIMREDVICGSKILVTSGSYPQLNGFGLFLGLSDRLVKREGEFFRYPHTTKVIWGGHRVVFIFREVTGVVTLYYDIELREPLGEQTAGGAMFPTTTLVTKNRIYVPVPAALEPAFRITSGTKEFYVWFDAITQS
jgi:molecular chaperone HtpG